MHHHRLAFSPCPNDTFMFHGLVHSADGVGWEVQLADIEQLNRAAAADDPCEATKLSVPALAQHLDTYCVLAAGAALGRGVGPLVVRRPGGPAGLDDLEGCRVAIPGMGTTANLLLHSFASGFRPVEMRFDEILAAVASGEVDAGVLIHESRLTFEAHGLEMAGDLGGAWEAATHLPLPLGVICVRRSLPRGEAVAFEHALRRSVQAAFEDPGASREYVREHAQELDPDVCRQHIDLYVNEFSVDLGDEGREAIAEMILRGVAAGLLPPQSADHVRDGSLFLSSGIDGLRGGASR